MLILHVPKVVSTFAVQRLSDVDYSVATRVSEDVAKIVQWANVHDQWWLAIWSMDVLQFWDNLGSLLISIVVWLVHNS